MGFRVFRVSGKEKVYGRFERILESWVVGLLRRFRKMFFVVLSCMCV